MKEKDLQKLVLGEMRRNGWNAAHFGNSVKYVRRGTSYIAIPDKDATGFPDIVAVREARLLFVELKAEKGRIRNEQALWLADLREVQEGVAYLLAAAGDVIDTDVWMRKDIKPSCVYVYVWRPIDWSDGTIAAALR